MPPSTRKRAPEPANDSQSPAKKPRTVKGEAATLRKVVKAGDDNNSTDNSSQAIPKVKPTTQRSKGTSSSKSLKAGDTDEKTLETVSKTTTTTKSIKAEETTEPKIPEPFASPSSKSNRSAQTKTVAVEETTGIDVKSDTSPKKKKTRKAKTKAHDKTEAGDSDNADATTTPKKPQRKRKTKEEKEAEAMPLAARATGLGIFIGAHVSGAKGALLEPKKEKIVYSEDKSSDFVPTGLI